MLVPAFLIIWHVPCSECITLSVQTFYQPDQKQSTKEVEMKKLAVQLFIIGVIVATYALPVLASGGSGP